MKTELTQIPRRIRELREILDIAPEQVAERLDIDVLEYRQLEEGEKDIPISLLYEIAAVLETDVTVLLTGDAPRMNSYTVVRKGDGVAVDRYAGYHYENLAFNFMNRTMDPMIVTLSKKDAEAALVTHSGQEFNLVLSGKMRVTIGKQSFVLNEGDSVYFSASLAHGQAAIDGETRFLTVIQEGNL